MDLNTVLDLNAISTTTEQDSDSGSDILDYKTYKMGCTYSSASPDMTCSSMNSMDTPTRDLEAGQRTPPDLQCRYCLEVGPATPTPEENTDHQIHGYDHDHDKYEWSLATTSKYVIWPCTCRTGVHYECFRTWATQGHPTCEICCNAFAPEHMDSVPLIIPNPSPPSGQPPEPIQRDLTNRELFVAICAIFLYGAMQTFLVVGFPCNCDDYPIYYLAPRQFMCRFYALNVVFGVVSFIALLLSYILVYKVILLYRSSCGCLDFVVRYNQRLVMTIHCIILLTISLTTQSIGISTYEMVNDAWLTCFIMNGATFTYGAIFMIAGLLCIGFFGSLPIIGKKCLRETDPVFQ